MSIFFWCAKENARKRKAHEPFPLDTRPPPRKHALGGSFLLARHMRPQTFGQCGLVRSALPPVPSPLFWKFDVCAAACGNLFFDISNSNVYKRIKECHSEERSDEESLIISLSFKRFFAALRMTVFHIVRVWRVIRESPYEFDVFHRANAVYPYCINRDDTEPPTN